MQPFATFRQVIRLGGKAGTVEQVTYILANNFGKSPFPAFYQRARARVAEDPREPRVHDVMLDRPEEQTRARQKTIGKLG